MLHPKDIFPRLKAWGRAEFSAEARATWLPRLAIWLRKQVSREAFSALLHVFVLLVILALSRSLFFQPVDASHYHADSIFLSMAQADLAVLARSAPKNTPTIPHILTFVVPMLLFWAARRRLRWDDWEHGKALRVFIMFIVLELCWSAATSPYNLYIDKAHGLDRLLITAAGLLSLRYPIFIPIAVKMSIVMIKEAYIPQPLDDFDFRGPAELALCFGVFVWASISRTFKPAHYFAVAVGSFAAMYYLAGLAKWNIGPDGAWVNYNHVSNVSVAGYVRGWLSFVPEAAFLKFAAFARQIDDLFHYYTLFIEIGAIVGMLLFRRLTRWWFLGCALLNFGIFAMTGICFWKWFVVSGFAFFWMGRGGRPLIARMHEYKLPLLLAVVAVYYSGKRIWYFPTPVAWFDTRLTENFEIYAIGKSGERYLVPGSYFKPSDMHWSQGALCYATKERTMTGIYATGSYNTSRLLDSLTPEELWKKHKSARSCDNPKRRARYDDFMKKFFRNLNRHGRKLTWLDWIGRPKHIWNSPKGFLNNGDNVEFDAQEKVAKIELWENLVFLQDGQLHRTEPKLVHTVEIPK